MEDAEHRRPADDDRNVEGQLEEMLRDAELTVARLRAELDARRAEAHDAETLAAQHAEIDRLAEHLSTAHVHWGEVRAFFEEAVGELRAARYRPPPGEADTR